MTRVIRIGYNYQYKRKRNKGIVRNTIINYKTEPLVPYILGDVEVFIHIKI